MPETPIEIVRNAFDSWSRGGIDAALELFDPRIEWTVRPDLPDAGIYRGHAEVKQLFARFDEVLEDQWVEPQEFVDAGGGTVVVPLHWGGRGKLSGVDVGERQGETWVFAVSNEKV